MPSLSNAFALLTPEYIDGVLDAYTYDPNRYIIPTWFPTRIVPVNQIDIDFQRPLNHGMTKPAVPGAVSPIIKAGSVKKKRIRLAHFREKVVFTEDETVAVRQLGSVDALQNGAEIVQRYITWLRGRLQDRIEWLGWQALMGSIAVNENGVNWTVPYPLPTQLNVTLIGADRWNQTATANPMQNVANMTALARHTGKKLMFFYMNRATADTVVQIDQFKDLLDRTVQGFSMSQLPPGMISIDIINQLMTRYLNEQAQFIIWDEGYHIETTNQAPFAQGGFSVPLDEVVGLEAGDLITIDSMNSDDQQLLTIDTIAGNIVTFTAAAAVDFPQGSTFHTYKRHIPDGKVVIIPQPNPGANQSVLPLGYLYQGPHVWSPPGSLLRPGSGPFMETQAHENEDPKRLEVISGAQMMAALWQRGSHAVLTVY